MKSLLFTTFIFLCFCGFGQNNQSYDVIIIGGGASGTAAGIQAARMGQKTLIIEETPWLGGMITSAGVAAFDGNHQISGGIFKEFRDSLYGRYGGAKSVETGWVSNTLFEPSVGNAIFQNICAKEKNLTLIFEAKWRSAVQTKTSWTISYRHKTTNYKATAEQIIDATELGDVAKMLGIPADIGMDSRAKSGEKFAPRVANNIVQDLTYVMILKDYKSEGSHVITKPKGYKASEFDCACGNRVPKLKNDKQVSCLSMLDYGKLPNGKYMINWPNCGNDIYMNIVNMTESQRNIELEKAKKISLRFLYFIQTELGFKNLGLADDEYSTNDKFPYIPYHRESRRIHGLARLNVNHLIDPFSSDKAYYRTGVVVGDYPIDHHHKKNLNAPNIDFIEIKTPAYNIPLGTLIPKSHKNIIVAEKSISVTNIVNGATRLQPVVLGIGQAAGALAAVASSQNISPDKVKIRDVQQALLDANAYLMPYIDTKPNDAQFFAMQKIGACGILKGHGVTYKWANQTWFYPELAVTEFELADGMRPLYKQLEKYWDASGEGVKLPFLVKLLKVLGVEKEEKDLINILAEQKLLTEGLLNRRQVSLIIDKTLNPFTLAINFDGHYTKN